MTSWATRTEAEVSAVVSIAASCARAPSGVCGNPVATPTSPTSIGAGISSVPVSPDDRLPGCAASKGASGSCLSASWSWADCAESDPVLSPEEEPVSMLTTDHTPPAAMASTTTATAPSRIWSLTAGPLGVGVSQL